MNRMFFILTSELEPLFLSCTDEDHTFSTQDRRKAMDILQTEKKSYQLQLFTKIAHGFALRGDLNNPYDRKLTGTFTPRG